MKTACLTLGLLLLAACCCNAMPKGLRAINKLGNNCCSKMSGSRLPLMSIAKITQTSPACAHQGFIFHTHNGRRFCYGQTFRWALDTYKTLQRKEASGHHA